MHVIIIIFNSSSSTYTFLVRINIQTKTIRLWKMAGGNALHVCVQRTKSSALPVTSPSASVKQRRTSDHTLARRLHTSQDASHTHTHTDPFCWARLYIFCSFHILLFFVSSTVIKLSLSFISLCYNTSVFHSLSASAGLILE